MIGMAQPLVTHDLIGINSAELAAGYGDTTQREHTVDRLTRRLEHLGYEVQLELHSATA
jgi:ubiquinone biosynthesis protein UbiJ